MSQSRSTTRIRISLASGEGSTGSPVGLIGAIALHLAIIGVTLFTWEHRLDIAQESVPVVPVDLVTLADKTNIAPAVRPEPKMEQIPVPQTAPPNLLAQTPPLPQEQSEPAPDQAQSEPVVKPPPLPAVPKAKPQPHPDTKKSIDSQMAALLNNLTTPSHAPAKASATPHNAAGAQTAMTADLRTIFYNEIRPCFDIGVLAGAPNPDQLFVFIDLSLNPDGTVAGKPQLAAQSSAAAGNPYASALRDAAFRAIYKCAPYKLPTDRYADWRSTEIRFSPQDFDQ